MEKEPKLEYIVIDFFETAGGEYDNLLNENKGKRFYSIERLNEILEKAKELYPEDETSYSKVYLDNFIRYGEDLYKFHYGRVDIDNTAVNIELPENYDEQIEKMFSENINSDKEYIKASIRKITTPKEKIEESVKLEEKTNTYDFTDTIPQNIINELPGECKITLYESSNGENYAEEYITELNQENKKLCGKLIESMGIFKLLGKNTPLKYSKPLRDGIYEIRAQFGNNESRALYFFVVGNEIIITHGFTKKTLKTPNEQIDKAINIRKDYYSNGGK